VIDSFNCLVVSGANQVDPDLVDAYYKDLLLQFWRFNPQVIPLNLLDTVYQSAIASLLVFKERRVLQVLPPPIAPPSLPLRSPSGRG